MKSIEIIKSFMRHSYRIAFIISLSLIINSCENEVKELPISLDQLVITDYILDNPETFSEFGAILQTTGIENLLRVRGPFTLMLPTNDAMFAYYQRLGVSSHTEIEMEELTNFTYNHIFQGSINSGSIGQGSLMYKNGLGDDVACDLVGTEIQLNKVAIIIKRDILVSNGYVHHIDYTLEPITESIYTVISKLDGYSIFTEALEIAGFKDTLEVIDFPYGNTLARNEFTLLAVPDTLYHREGIATIDDLIEKYGTDGNELDDKNNGFYQYVEYHCLSGTHYFSDFTPGENGDIYYLISYDNYISILVEQDYKINNTDTSFTGFYYEQSNIPSKNGTIHTVNNLLPNAETEAAEIIFQCTDYFDLQQGAFYQNNYERFYDGQNTFEKIKWDAEYLLYYFKNEDKFWDTDGLGLTGNWWIEITLPKIRKGTYAVSPYWFGSGILSLYIDGVYFVEANMSENIWEDYFPIPDVVTFDETKEHTLRIQTVISSSIWWDRIKFTPVE